jgi:hypothetical protein
LAPPLALLKLQVPEQISSLASQQDTNPSPDLDEQDPCPPVQKAAIGDAVALLQRHCRVADK